MLSASASISSLFKKEVRCRLGLLPASAESLACIDASLNTDIIVQYFVSSIPVVPDRGPEYHPTKI